MVLKVSAKLLQNPVLLSSSCSNISCCQMIPLVGRVTIESSKRQKIGGVRVVWESRVQRRLRNPKNGKLSWTDGDSFEKFEVDVLQGPYWVPAGQTVFEFVIEIPLTLVSSRTTAFDNITHWLHAALLGASPCYDRLNEECIDTRSAGFFSVAALPRFLTTKRPHGHRLFGDTPLLARSESPLTVHSCDTEDETTACNFTYATEMNGLGQLNMNLNSQQLVLGQTADLRLHLSGLSPTTTIHNIVVNLVQKTNVAVCPSKYSSSSSISSDDQVQQEVTDVYQLYSFGVPWPFLHTRPRPYRGSYVWRGAEAGQYTSERLGLGDLQTDKHTDEGFTLSTTLAIPSPIIGAMASSTSCDPAFATISHHLDVRFVYSVLQDAVGADTEPSEGPTRTWTIEKTLDIHSDLASATATAAPPYAEADAMTHHCIVAPLMDLASTKAHRSTSLGSLLVGQYMRPVRMDETDLRIRTQRHWDETGGLCACFDQSEVCGCARREVVAFGRQEKA